jgi:hypothetical protein
MAELSIEADYLRMLIVQVRAVMAKVSPEVGEEGSNPTDDPISPLPCKMRKRISVGNNC